MMRFFDGLCETLLGFLIFVYFFSLLYLAVSALSGDNNAKTTAKIIILIWIFFAILEFVIGKYIDWKAKNYSFDDYYYYVFGLKKRLIDRIGLLFGIISIIILIIFLGGKFNNDGSAQVETTKLASYSSYSNNVSGFSNQYFVPDSNSRYYTDEEVCDWDYITLRNAINEIYARHGDVFNESGKYSELQELQDHFESCDWYTPIYGKTDEECYAEFNEYELVNSKLFNKYKKLKSKL